MNKQKENSLNRRKLKLSLYFDETTKKRHKKCAYKVHRFYNHDNKPHTNNPITEDNMMLIFSPGRTRAASSGREGPTSGSPAPELLYLQIFIYFVTTKNNLFYSHMADGPFQICFLLIKYL